MLKFHVKTATELVNLQFCPVESEFVTNSLCLVGSGSLPCATLSALEDV